MMNDEAKIASSVIGFITIMILGLIIVSWGYTYKSRMRRKELEKDYLAMVKVFEALKSIHAMKGSDTSAIKCAAFRKVRALDWYDGFMAKYSLTEEEMREYFEEYLSIVAAARRCNDVRDAYNEVSHEKLEELAYLLSTIKYMESAIEKQLKRISTAGDEYTKMVIETHLCKEIKVSGAKKLYDKYVDLYGTDDVLLKQELELQEIDPVVVQQIVNSKDCIVSPHGVALVSSIRRKLATMIETVTAGLMRRATTGIADASLCAALRRHRFGELVKEYYSNDTFKSSLLLEYVLMDHFQMGLTQIQSLVEAIDECVAKY